jgi:deazaflavin-dependent oxidoreductase (nitroreductase family)
MTDISKPIASLLSIRLHPKLIRAGGRLHLALLRRFRSAAAFLGTDTLVLTTHGRRSGRPRSTPVYYVRHDDRLYIAASFAGRDAAPNWYLNLLANPEVTIEAAGDRGTYHARVLSPTDADEIWPQLIATYPPFARYQRRTTRTIPVIELSRVDPRVVRRRNSHQGLWIGVLGGLSVTS